jgi:hypothetical protein
MTLTLHLPDELAAFLPEGNAEMAAVMAAGLRKWSGSKQHQVTQLADVTELLAKLPSPETVLALRPTIALTQRTEQLLIKNREATSARKNRLSGRKLRSWNI